MVSAAMGLPNALASNTRCVPRLGRSLIEVSTSPAHTPVALMTARADTSNDSPVRWSVRRTEVPVAFDARDTGQDARAVLGGGAGDRGDQAGVVDQLPVVGEQPAAQARRGARWAPSRSRALASMRRDRGSVEDGVPASLRSASPATKPVRTSARDAVFIAGSSGTSCGMALTR